jgi:hypothetical protein
MDKPKCKLCGAKHWANEPHQIDDRAILEKAGIVRLDPYTSPPAGPVRAGPPAQIVEKFDRAAYQRQYMVEWRKRRKAKKEPKV